MGDAYTRALFCCVCAPSVSIVLPRCVMCDDRVTYCARRRFRPAAFYRVYTTRYFTGTTDSRRRRRRKRISEFVPGRAQRHASERAHCTGSDDACIPSIQFRIFDFDETPRRRHSSAELFAVRVPVKCKRIPMRTVIVKPM